MSTWEIVVVAIGGNAVLLAVLGFLARSVVGQLLTKDLERFKAELLANSSAATERLKHELQLAAQEQSVLVTNLQEKRAAVIAELYGLLVEAHWAAQDFAAPMEWAGAPTKREKYITAMNKSAEFYRFFDKNRIYLPSALCEKLESFVREMRTKVVGFGVHVGRDETALPDHAIQKKMDAWLEASDYFAQKAPKTREALEMELRRILGAAEDRAS